MDLSVKRRGEYISPVPAVISSPEPVVEFLAPAPAVFHASLPVEEHIAPAPAAFQAPTSVVEYLAPVPAAFHAPVFPLSPDASDMSAPEDMYTSSWVSLPVPIKTCTSEVGAKAGGQACETPTVMHGRGIPAVSRDMGVGFAQWLRKEAARRGYAWRKQRRAQQLCLLRAACVPPGGVVGEEALRLAPPGAGVLVEVLRELATRAEYECEWQKFWRWC